jgi:hypothetical protein
LPALLTIAVLLALVVLLSGCVVHYVADQCPQCRVINGRSVSGKQQKLPFLSPDTKRLFVLVPGALGYGPEWNPAIRNLELERANHLEFVVFWWEPWGTIGAASDQLAAWSNALVSANRLPELAEVNIVAHSAGGLVAAHAAPQLVVPPGVKMRISTLSTAFAGLLDPFFIVGYLERRFAPAVLVAFSPWPYYPAIPPSIEFVEYRTTWPPDLLMREYLWHDPSPRWGGPLPRRRVRLTQVNHDQVVGDVVQLLLRP